MNKSTLKTYGLEMTNVSYAHISKKIFTQNFKMLCKNRTVHSKHILKPAGVVVENHGLSQVSQSLGVPRPWCSLLEPSQSQVLCQLKVKSPTQSHSGPPLDAQPLFQSDLYPELIYLSKFSTATEFPVTCFQSEFLFQGIFHQTAQRGFQSTET